MMLRRERPALLSPEGSALEGEPQVLAHQVANPVGATKLVWLMFFGLVFEEL